MLANTQGIKVVFRSGALPCTDGEIITLPALPDDADRKLVNATHGYLDHETSHCIFMDEDMHGQEGFKKAFGENAVLKNVWNVFEDIRDENKLMIMWPGVRTNFRNMNEYVNEKVQEINPVTGNTYYNDMSSLHKSLVAFYTWEKCGRNEDHPFWRDVVPHEVKQFVYDNENFIDEAKACPTSKDVIELARTFMKKVGLKEFEDKKPQQGQSQRNQKGKKDSEKSEDCQSSNSGESEDKEEGDSSENQESKSDSSEDNQESDSQDSSGNGDSEEDKDSQDSNSSNEGDSQEEDSSSGTKELKVTIKNSDGSEIKIEETKSAYSDSQKLADIRELLQEAGKYEMKESDDPYKVFSNENDEIIRMGHRHNDREMFSHIEKRTSAMTKVIKRRLARALVTQTYTRWDCDKRRGKINRRALHTLIVGKTNRIFKQKQLDLHYDTSVMLAIDHSGSMGGHKAEVATQTAILLGDVLNQIGVPFSVVGFTAKVNSGDYDKTRGLNPKEQRMFTRFGSLWIGIYKDFEDMWGTKKFRVAQIQNNIQANTYDGESVRWCARALLERKEKRKILIFINDGEPCPTSLDNHEAHTHFAKEVGKEIHKYIEMVAIGIQSETIKQFYPKAININNVEDLGGTVLNELVKYLNPTTKRS